MLSGVLRSARARPSASSLISLGNSKALRPRGGNIWTAGTCLA